MSGKRKSKKRQNRSTPKRPSRVALSSPPPSPEDVVGAVVESIAPALFDTTDGSRDSSSGGSAALASEEHRAHPRVALSVAIGLASESHFFSGLSGDISEGGVFVQTYRDLPVGRNVEVHFHLPDGELTARGRVRWHRASSESSPPGVGIAFEDLADSVRGVIQRFCEHRAPLYYEVDHA